MPQAVLKTSSKPFAAPWAYNEYGVCMSISSVVAQDRAVDQLQQALRSKRVPHAYIFHGPAGVGKELCAGEFAKIILCENRQKKRHNKEDFFDCCDTCVSCRGIEADTHPDFHLVYREQIRELEGESGTHKATTLAIDVIREKLNRPARLTSAYGQGKVFVVREIHLANAAAQNALLKTLEEPPDGTVLILLADQLEGLLPTVISRCQIVTFSPLPEDFLLERLSQAGYEQLESRFWARFADGSLGRALWFAHQQWYETKIELLEHLALLSDSRVVESAELLMNLAKTHASQLRKQDPVISDTVAKHKMYSFLLAVIGTFYRDLMLCRSGSTPSACIHADQEPLLASAAEGIDLRDASRAVSLIARAEHLIHTNVNANLVLEDLLGDLAQMNPLGPQGRASPARTRQ